MPPSILITTKVLEYLAAVAFGLIATTFLITRVFYVRRIAKCKAGTRALEQQIQDLHRSRMTETKSQPVAAPSGTGQQLVAIIVAIGGLSALVAAATPLVHDFLEGKYTQCTASLADAKNDLTKLEQLMDFDPTQWRAAEAVRVPNQQAARNQTILLGNNKIESSDRDTIAVTYDGESPAFIESDRSVKITMTLKKPSNGVQLLVRPIRVQNPKK
jgi:hypothetical protein